MVDTLLRNVERARGRAIVGELQLQPGGYGLVTLHRPSNVDDPDVLARLVGVLGDVARETPLVFPAHPRTSAPLAALHLPAGPHVTAPPSHPHLLAPHGDARL